jgi:hypothetical protein
MSKPTNYPLNIKIGDTETVTVTRQDSTGTPINITGRTYSAQVRAKASSSTPLATFSCAIVNAANGIFACTLSATTTAALVPANAVWDLQEVNGSVVTTLLTGPAYIEKDITR